MSSAVDIKQPSSTTVLSRTVLIPASIVFTLVIGGATVLTPRLWDVAAAWELRGYEIATALKDVKELRLSVSIMETELKYFRLEVERKLGPMPNFPGDKPTISKGESGGNTLQRRGTEDNLQANQVLGSVGETIASRGGDPIIRSSAANLP